MNKKILAFSGLGGSGKTTYIRKIKESLSRDILLIIAMREKLLWPKISIFLKDKNLDDGNISVSQDFSDKKRNIFFTYIRATFYVFDFWRIYLSVVLRPGKGIIIFDRFFHDFIIELTLDSNRSHFWMVKFLPKPFLHFYFNVSAKVVYERKKEAPLNVIERQHKEYQNTFKKSNVFVFDSTKNIDGVCDKIFDILDLTKDSKKNVSFLGFVAFKIINDNSIDYFNDEIINFDKKQFLKYASYNRSLWFFARNLGDYLNLRKDEKIIKEVIDICNKSLESFQSTINHFKNMYPKWDRDVFFNKNDLIKVDKSSDVDLVVFDKNVFSNVLDCFKKIPNTIISYQSKNKVDIYQDGFKPIDLHLGFEFIRVSYISKKDILSKKQESISVCSVVGHLLSELTMINWGDYLKIKEYLIDEDEVRKMALSAGWGREMNFVLNKYKDIKKDGFNMPYLIPVHILILMRIKFFLKGKLNFRGFLKESIVILKQIRARKLGFIPFHDEWYRF